MSGSKHLLFRDALKSEIYMNIVDEIAERLPLHGCFEIAAILRATGYECVSDAIRWDYVVRMFEDQSVTLIPVNEAYFKRNHSEAAKRKDPQKYLAGGGHGKYTAGYCQATRENGHFVLKKLEITEQVAVGVEASVIKVKDLIRRHGIEHDPEQPQLTGTT